MIPEFDALTFWLGETYIHGTALLFIAIVTLSLIKQPVRRIPVAWSAMAGLVALAILPALSWWPRLVIPVWQSAAPAQKQVQFGQFATVTSNDSGPARADEPAMNQADDARLPVVEVLAAELDNSPKSAADTMGMTSPLDVDLTDQNGPRGIEHATSGTTSVALNSGVAAVMTEFPAAPYVWKVWATELWLSGALLATIWIAVGAWRVRRVFRRSQEAPAWIQDELRHIVPAHRREPATRISRLVASALAYGAMRPSILLRDSQGEPDERRGVRAALAHEYAHIAHGDLWLLALERVLLPVYFAHPLFWLLRRWIRTDQELLADAAAAGEAPLEYAEALLEWAKSAPLMRSPGFAAGLPLWNSPCHLKRRIEMLLDVYNPISRHASRFWHGSVLTTILFLATGLSLVTFRAAHSAQEAVDRESVAQTQAGADTLQSGPTPAAAPAPPPHAYIVEVDVVLVHVDHEKLALHEKTLAKLVSAACDPAKTSKSKDGVVGGYLSSERFQKLFEDIKAHGAGTILAEPRLSAAFEANPTYQDPASGEAAIAGGAEDMRVHIDGGLDGAATLRIHTEPIDLGNSKPVRLKMRVTAEYTPRTDADSSDDRELQVESSSKRKISYATQLQLGESVIIADGPSKNVPAAKSRSANLIIVTPRAVTPMAKPNSNTGPSQELEALRKLVEELKQEIRGLRSQPSNPPSEEAHKAGGTKSDGTGRNIEQELLRLDIQEAELNVNAAKVAYETAQKANDANAVADRLAALRKAQIALERTRLRAERVVRPPAGAADVDVKENTAGKNRSLAEKLRELDDQEAQNDFDAAKEAYDFKVWLHKKGYLSDSELAVAKLVFQKAELAKKRADLRLKSDQPPTADPKKGSSNLDRGLEQIRQQKLNIEGLELQLQAAKQALQGQTLPSANYSKDDLQSFPPGPEFKLSKQVQAMEEYKTRQNGLVDVFKFSAPLGFRNAQANVRNIELRLAKAKAALAEMEMETTIKPKP